MSPVQSAYIARTRSTSPFESSSLSSPPRKRPGPNSRRTVDSPNVDNSVATTAPGQSAQPGSPYYGNNRERLANGQYFPLPYTRGAVDTQAAHTLKLTP